MIFNIWPVVISAIYSALIWNFFFTPPLLDFTIGSAEDGLLFLMYFRLVATGSLLSVDIKIPYPAGISHA